MTLYYDIVTAEQHELIIRVNRMVGDGWIPIGGIVPVEYGEFSQVLWRPPIPAAIKDVMTTIQKTKSITR